MLLVLHNILLFIGQQVILIDWLYEDTSMGYALKWVGMVFNNRLVLRLCWDSDINLIFTWLVLFVIVDRLLLRMIMGHFVNDLNFFEVRQGLMVLDIVNDGLNGLNVVMYGCHCFVNYGNGDIERALVRVRFGVVESFEDGVLVEVNRLYIMLIVVFVLKFMMRFVVDIIDLDFSFVDYWYLLVHTM